MFPRCSGPEFVGGARPGSAPSGRRNLSGPGALALRRLRRDRTALAFGLLIVNRGLEHELHSAGGCTFIEALAPVPLDHVPDRRRDLVLGPDGGSGHVER